MSGADFARGYPFPGGISRIKCDIKAAINGAKNKAPAPQEAVFLTMVVPYRPFAQSSHISTTVALAPKRAGISDPPSIGACLLRRSAATSMLRSGATLEAVGTVLPQRSLDMTAHYAKVDVAMLEQIAALAGRAVMLSQLLADHAALRRALGFKFRAPGILLRNFVAFAEHRGEDVITTATAHEWALQAPSPERRRNRLLAVRRFALSLHAEDPRHEVPSADLFGRAGRRRAPYIYSPGDIRRLIDAAHRLGPDGSIRSLTYATMFGLIAATGMRVSEAIRVARAAGGQYRRTRPQHGPALDAGVHRQAGRRGETGLRTQRLQTLACRPRRTDEGPDSRLSG